MVLDKDVPSQEFDEPDSYLIIGANREDSDFTMMDMFMKMIIRYIDMLCARLEFGEPSCF